jgi:hypothetical protein
MLHVFSRPSTLSSLVSRFPTQSGPPIATMPSQQPPTPPSSDSGSKMSSRASTTDLQAQQLTPLKRKRDKPIIVPNDGALKEEPYFLDDQAMQRVADLLTQDKCINDDCINKVLEVFNPDTAAWYVASTYLVLQGEHPETISPKQKELLVDPPRKLLFPLHLSSMSHWALAVFDRKHNRCLVFDPLGSKKCSELASKIVQEFLKRHGLWKGEVAMDCDPFPSVRQTDSVNCGIFVLAVALHLLHGRTVETVTPKLWRELLAAYFFTKSEPPREWLTSYLASTSKSADSERIQNSAIEQKIEDAERMSAATSDVKACAQEIRLLLDLVDVQVSILEKREGQRGKLINIRMWCVGMPECADRLTRGVITAYREKITAELRALPKMVKGGVRQLRKIRNSCARAIDDCEQVASTMERRRIDLLEKAMKAYHDFTLKLAALEK